MKSYEIGIKKNDQNLKGAVDEGVLYISNDTICLYCNNDAYFQKDWVTKYNMNRIASCPEEDMSCWKIWKERKQIIRIWH